MKPKTILTLLLAAVAIAAQAQNNFKIDAVVKNIDDGEIVVLMKHQKTTYVPFSRDTIKGGKFSFEGSVDSVQRFALSGYSNKFPPVYIDIYVAPYSYTTITGNNYFINDWRVINNVNEQKENETYRNAVRKYAATHDSLFRLDYKLIDMRDTTRNANERENAILQLKKIRQEEDSIIFLRQKATYELMKTMPITDYWMEKLYIYSSETKEFEPYIYKSDLIDLYQRLTDNQKESEIAKLIYSNLYPKQTIKQGEELADSEFIDPQGNKHHLSEYKGKYVLLDFWGIYCAPCILAFDEMKEIYASHKDKLTIISISTDTKENWLLGLQKHSIPWVNLNDLKGFDGYISRYKAQGIPFYVLISPDGTVEKMWSGYGKGSLKKKLKDVLL